MFEKQVYIKRETETLLSVSLIINLFYARLWVKAIAEYTNIIVKNTISKKFLHFKAVLVGQQTLMVGVAVKGEKLCWPVFDVLLFFV